MLKRLFPLLAVLSGLLLSACGGLGNAEPTAVPFNKYTAQDVIRAFNAAGLSIINAQRDMVVGRDAPGRMADRYTFEMADLPAGSGGQILIFDSPETMQAWTDFFTTLRNDPATRSSAIYVFTKDNVILQINSTLMPAQATDYSDALMAMP